MKILGLHITISRTDPGEAFAAGVAAGQALSADQAAVVTGRVPAPRTRHTSAGSLPPGVDGFPLGRRATRLTGWEVAR